MSQRGGLGLIVGSIFSGVASLLPFAAARAQDPHDYALHKAIKAAQLKVIAAARAGDDDTLAFIYRNSMLELILYKQKYNILDGVAQNPCQRAYEEFSISIAFLASYIQPARQASGPIDKSGNGRDADRYWTSHQETLAECERFLKFPKSPLVGPDTLSGIVPK